MFLNLTVLWPEPFAVSDFFSNHSLSRCAALVGVWGVWGTWNSVFHGEELIMCLMKRSVGRAVGQIGRWSCQNWERYLPHKESGTLGPSSRAHADLTQGLYSPSSIVYGKVDTVGTSNEKAFHQPSSNRHFAIIRGIVCRKTGALFVVCSVVLRKYSLGNHEC